MSTHREPKDDAMLQHKALCIYESVASLLAHKVEFPPPAKDIAVLDTWVEEVYSQWALCNQFWQRAGIRKKLWHDLEFQVIQVVDKIDQDDVGDSQAEFNALADRAHDYGVNICPIPLPHQTSPSRRLVLASPTPQSGPSSNKSPGNTSMVRTPIQPPAHPPAQSARTAVSTSGSPLTIRVPASSTGVATKPAAPAATSLKSPQLGPSSSSQPRVLPCPILKDSTQTGVASLTTLASNKISAAFKANESSFGAPVLLQSPIRPPTAGPPAASVALSALLTVNAASRPRVFPGPDPTRVDEDNEYDSDNNAELLEESQAAIPPSTLRAPDSKYVTADTVPLSNDVEDFKEVDVAEVDMVKNPPPVDSIHRHHDYPVKPVVPLSQGQDTCHSIRHISSSNPDATYLKLVEGSKLDSRKKDKKDSKGKGKVKAETTASRKRSWDDEDGGPILEKPVTKKQKSQGAKVVDEKVIHAMPVIQKCGPGLSKLPPVSLGVSGGGFGELVLKEFHPVNHGVESIVVLVVEEDLGDFVKVNGQLWNKQVAPFVGERYLKPCDQCRSHKTQCRKLLGHMVICVHCHYAKQLCSVDRETVLNPVDHYHPQGSFNSFESALNSLNQSNEAIASLTQTFLAGLHILSHNENICVQLARLQDCIIPEGSDEDEDDGRDTDDEVAEGEAGPSFWKSKQS
ncbi:hypothetical protein F5146DRAFT_1132197 [Armillaria mellea]|nr:hypothetical protein F5146DRAFT_1132197 [Armillaria mellea]